MAGLPWVPPEFLGTIETWDHAERELKRALEAVGQPYRIDEGDGALSIGVG